jgi:hypothetical protein
MRESHMHSFFPVFEPDRSGTLLVQDSARQRKYFWSQLFFCVDCSASQYSSSCFKGYYILKMNINEKKLLTLTGREMDTKGNKIEREKKNKYRSVLLNF